MFVRVAIFAVEKGSSITYSEGVSVALGISSMNCAFAVLYRHLWPARIYEVFPLYLINGTIFEKKNKLLNVKCVL